MTRTRVPSRTEVLPASPVIPEAVVKLARQSSRAELRNARRLLEGLQARAATAAGDAGLELVEAAYGPSEDPVRAVTWWRQLIDALGAVGRQKAAVTVLEAEAGSGCTHVCPIHPNPAAEQLDAARSELAHVMNAAARLGATPAKEPR